MTITVWTVLHAWGMTEMSPARHPVQRSSCKHDWPSTGRGDSCRRSACKQGRAIYGVDMKIVDRGRQANCRGTAKTFGDLLCQGPLGHLRAYFKNEGGDPLKDGWFPTGDVATIDPDGYMQITDRSKDVIKSGGEWISSIDVENIAVAHPAVAMAACIAWRTPSGTSGRSWWWSSKPGAEVTREETCSAFYEGKIAKWQVPDDVAFRRRDSAGRHRQDAEEQAARDCSRTTTLPGI